MLRQSERMHDRGGGGVKDCGSTCRLGSLSLLRYEGALDLDLLEGCCAAQRVLSTQGVICWLWAS